MAIRYIREEKCIGCGNCVRNCGCDVIRMDKTRRKAVVLYPEDCMVCGFCVLDCPVQAVVLSPEKNRSVSVAFE